MELVDLKIADSSEPTSQEDEPSAEAVVIKEVETGFDKLEEGNKKAEKKEVAQVAAKVDDLEGAIITIAKVETKEALDKDEAEER